MPCIPSSEAGMMSESISRPGADFPVLLLRLPWQWLRRKPQPAQVQRVLILHQFLLGDALMATSLLAKARQRYPQADIVMACPPGQAALYAGQPYGVRAFGWHIRNFASVCQLFAMPRFDLVLLMGENRLSYSGTCHRCALDCRFCR
jgi:hypothetical protein